MPTVRPKIAIPEPHSQNKEYSERVLPQYEQAVRQAGGEPVIVPVKRSPEEIAKILARCDAVLLPGSRADVEPSKYGEQRKPETAEPDALRDGADELLLQDAYNMRKPVLGICYGMQSLNVWRTGTLVQHLPDRPVKHDIGREAKVAHSVSIDPTSELARIVSDAPHTGLAMTPDGTGLRLPVNSSHHQAVGVVGDGLRAVARCPDDGVIEAIEGTAPDHFVLGVQWHPERSIEEDATSCALFAALVEAVRKKQ